jgi:regulator of sigma E protease
VSGHAVSTWTGLKSLIGASTEDVLVLEVRRGAGTLRIDVRPETVPGSHSRMIGVTGKTIVEPPPALPARLGDSLAMVGRYFEQLAEGVGSLFAPRTTTVGGPIVLYEVSPHAALWRGRERAFAATLMILQYLLYCFCFPFLDGSRLLFLLVEVAARRPVHPRYELWLNRAWVGAFGLLAILIIKHDVLRAIVR